MYSLQKIADITGAKLVATADQNIQHYIADSRAVQNTEDVLFIAIKTGRNNGHFYIEDLITKGVTAFLIEFHEFDFEKHSQGNIAFLIVDNTLEALQKLAAWHRLQFNIPVIGITGSNGKTIVKEWLYQLLKNDYSICRSPKSYNSQLGVPLSILNLNKSHTLGIFEAGISLPNEMKNLLAIIKPTIGVFTSLGSAHNEGFTSLEQKFNEKLNLFEHAEHVILNLKEEMNLPEQISKKASVISPKNIHFTFLNGVLTIYSPTKTYEFKTTFNDEASISNIVTCVITLLHLGYKYHAIQENVNFLQPVALRLEIKTGIHQSQVINDFYNSDLDSIKIALNFLQQQSRHSKKVVVVSDIEQSGMLSANLYKTLAELLTQYKVDTIIGIGKNISVHRSYFKSNSLFYSDTQNFLQQFHLINHQFYNATIY
jgi:Alr-MurF fusion protein